MPACTYAYVPIIILLDNFNLPHVTKCINVYVYFYLALFVHVHQHNYYCVCASMLAMVS